MAWDLKNRERVIAEINITPLTDVMLVLLVIFMVATPLMISESFKIKLPKAASSTAEPGKGVVITVDEAGVVRIKDKTVPLESLSRMLSVEFGDGAEKTIVIKGDVSARHGVVVKVLDIAKKAGAERLSIAAEPGR